MAHGDIREKWRGNWQMEWVASTLHTTSEHGVTSITTADKHTSAASSRLNWRPRRFKWTRPFRRKTKSGFCTCAITFQLQSKTVLIHHQSHHSIQTRQYYSHLLSKLRLLTSIWNRSSKETDHVKQQAMYVLIYKSKNTISHEINAGISDWQFLNASLSLASQNDCQAHHQSSMQFDWWNNELLVMHGCSVSIQLSALHFSYCPMARLNYFFVSVKHLQGLGKLNVSVPTTDIFFSG